MQCIFSSCWQGNIAVKYLPNSKKNLPQFSVLGRGALIKILPASAPCIDGIVFWDTAFNRINRLHLFVYWFSLFSHFFASSIPVRFKTLFHHYYWCYYCPIIAPPLLLIPTCNHCDSQQKHGPGLFCMSLQFVTCVCWFEHMLAYVHAQGKLPLASLTLARRRFPPTVWRQQGPCVCVSVCACWRACVGDFLCDVHFQPSGYKEGDNHKTVSESEDGTVGQVAWQLRNSGGVQRGMPTINKSQPLWVQVPHRQAKLHCRPAAPSSPFLPFCHFPSSSRRLLLQCG